MSDSHLTLRFSTVFTETCRWIGRVCGYPKVLWIVLAVEFVASSQQFLHAADHPSNAIVKLASSVDHLTMQVIWGFFYAGTLFMLLKWMRTGEAGWKDVYGQAPKFIRIILVTLSFFGLVLVLLIAAFVPLFLAGIKNPFHVPLLKQGVVALMAVLMFFAITLWNQALCLIVDRDIRPLAALREASELARRHKRPFYLFVVLQGLASVPTMLPFFLAPHTPSFLQGMGWKIGAHVFGYFMSVFCVFFVVTLYEKVRLAEQTLPVNAMEII